MTKLNQLLNELSKEFPLCNIYTYGSWVYKTNSELSDFDFIITGPNVSTTSEVRDFGDIHFYSVPDFRNKLIEHEISILECLFLSNDLKIEKSSLLEFTLNLSNLRDSCSQKASNSWVKAKKKILIENEPYIAQKSLFHSLRILKFAIQIAQYGKIVDFNQSHLWNEIKSLPLDWELWNQNYKPVYNSLKSEFKRISPKN